ncbi:MAG: LysE family transporter, partial [Gammaproteobacteria bacterium]|nr:LysE family transporter [Gammaproteobacteria bacterium]
CALSDALLILIGVSGFHVLVASFPALVDIARIGGATFLFIYGLISFYNALRVQVGLQPSEIKSNSAWQSALTCLAFTWLNPHVYLDTVVLLGSVSTQFSEQLGWFAAGAMSSSFVFFFALGYGARLLRPVFAEPRAWRLLDFLIGCIMWTIALRLVFMT